MYKIEVKSGSDQLWRFNVVATCAGIDSNAEQIAFSGAKKITSETFQSQIVAHDTLEKYTEKIDASESILEVELTDEKIEKVHVIVYFITHTLPENRSVEEQPPFAANVTITRNNEVIYDDTHDVNQWGGATIDVVI